MGICLAFITAAGDEDDLGYSARGRTRDSIGSIGSCRFRELAVIWAAV